MDSAAASASSRAACATDIPQRRATYALYLATDLVFAAVSLARLVATVRLGRAQRRAASGPAQPLLDRTGAPAAPAASPVPPTATVSLTPKILYFSLTLSTCIGLPPSYPPSPLHAHAHVPTHTISPFT